MDTTYREVVFLQGDEAQEIIDRLDEVQPEVVAQELFDTYGFGDEPREWDSPPWGQRDRVSAPISHYGETYVLTWLPGLYVGLTQVICDGIAPSS